MDKLYAPASSPEEVAALLAELGEPKYRTEQVCDWLFAKRVSSFDDMRNVPKGLRDKLSERIILRRLQPQEHQVAADGLTEKWLFATSDGHGVETVLIRERERRTVCVSSSLGCALNCAFCASARGPMIRHLDSGEMVEQVMRVGELAGETITNVVFMGTGEPFLNYENVIAAGQAMNYQKGLGIGARHVTISTVGVIPGIERFAAEPVSFRLAVSLHAPTQHQREELIPAAHNWPLDRLMAVLRRYSRQKHREVTFEYVLIDGFNASPRDAENLARLVKDVPCKINCIPYNNASDKAYRAPALPRCHDFIKQLVARDLRVTLRTEKGGDIDAACGQLRARKLVAPQTDKGD